MQRAAVGFPHNDNRVVAQFLALPTAVQAAKLGLIYICTGYPLASTDHKILWFLSSHPGKSATVCRADKIGAIPLGFRLSRYSQPRVASRSFLASTAPWADIGSSLRDYVVNRPTAFKLQNRFRVILHSHAYYMLWSVEASG